MLILNMPLVNGFRVAVYDDRTGAIWKPSLDAWVPVAAVVADDLFARLMRRADGLPGPYTFKGCTRCGTDRCGCQREAP